MTFNKNKNITVNMCYELKGHRECLTLNKYDALNLRNYINNEKGAVWWFTAI
tara:strand:+ start:147 stop:302 length:156 start_codon:yes stop_codon:yes gene_type:complete